MKLKYLSQIKITLFLGFTIIIMSCSPAMLNRRIQVERADRPKSGNRVAVLNVQFINTSEKLVSSFYLNSLKNSIRNALFNSGAFGDIYLKEDRKSEDTDVFVDVTVTPSEDGSYSWIITWPAVYPLPLYWPLQKKEGEAVVNMDVKIMSVDIPRKEFSIHKVTPYSILFYGFFRTSPIEEALQESYYGALDELEKKFQAMAFAPVDTYDEQVTLTDTDNKKTNIAVVDLEAISVTTNEARTLTNKLRGELVRTHKYLVIERSQMEEILNEQGFQLTGLCKTDECYVEAGKLLGVKQLVGGSIGKVGNTYLISLRLIDVETGAILKVVDEEIEGSIDLVLKKGVHNVVAKLTR